MAGSGLTCPACGSDRVHRSRARTLFERLRKRWSSLRLHRCHECGWRGWRKEVHLGRFEEAAGDPKPLDFTKIDEAVPLRSPAPGQEKAKES